MKVLVTGSGGLIGYESCNFFLQKNAEVVGVDNNMRRYFFGEKGDTTGNITYLESLSKKFRNIKLDIRNRNDVLKLFEKEGHFDLIIHTAAQPSHDWAAKEPFTDFDVNAVGTLNMLESFRLYSPKGVFIFTSTNKVYGDAPNKVNLIEQKTRWKYDNKQIMSGISLNGVSEQMTIDDSTHSVFGASKVAADVMAQEYGRYFNLNVGVFRGGCLTGPQHSAVELHGFLAYIVDCAVTGKPYTIFGYKGKQVRDQIHSRDVVAVFYEFYKNPKQGVAYNLGGCKENSISILEVIDLLDKDFGLKLNYTYSETNRIGDHICYYSDMSKFKKDYPNWKITIPVKEIIKEMIEWKNRKR
ncbi:MAG: NAD-dependent epimerase/dehydratase family protein [Nanoarchaeota archaeon]|nr:NAD-dependent epimerase/dehydratase family protein [Nanoarchaeota archaeon]MBU1029976.1 NAD-dependent epimerase/dehydratase family protein [Nanoarchaeota archaeon]MBU1849253.1 NAD-dependent epimerase/dehydratase family protein [Nanoarchaeota archaeon]